MVFDVRLIKDVDSVAVAKFVPAFIVRVMAGAHRIEVVFLESLYVVNHFRSGKSLGIGLVVLVAVHSVDVDFLGIEQQLAPLYFHGLKPNCK